VSVFSTGSNNGALPFSKKHRHNLETSTVSIRDQIPTKKEFFLFSPTRVHIYRETFCIESPHRVFFFAIYGQSV